MATQAWGTEPSWAVNEGVQRAAASQDRLFECCAGGGCRPWFRPVVETAYSV
jgi:hypothetical protein